MHDAYDIFQQVANEKEVIAAGKNRDDSLNS